MQRYKVCIGAEDCLNLEKFRETDKNLDRIIILIFRDKFNDKLCFRLSVLVFELQRLFNFLVYFYFYLIETAKILAIFSYYVET